MLASLPTVRDRRMAAHFLNRVSFGPRPGDVDALLQRGIADYVDEALTGPAADPELEKRLTPFASLRRTALENWNHIKERPDELLRDDLYSGKIVRTVYARNQFLEILTDFWYNHFNVLAHERYPLIAPYERDAIRPHVFGRFRDLLEATAAHPAMLTYLDNTSNVANRYENGTLVEGLNENYGRELMELHTVSVHGGYSQIDVTEAARAFTGWQADCFSTAPTFAYKYAASKHDHRAKHIMGLTLPADSEERDGKRLLDYLAAHSKTAHFVAWRLAQRLVADDPPAALVEQGARTFTRSQGNLRDVVLTLLSSKEFWSVEAVGMKAKNPLEFVTSALRAVDAEIHDTREITHGALRRMGMLPYECSPPCGYSNRGSDWISSSDQVQRFDFGLRLATNTLPGVSASLDRLTGPSSDAESIIHTSSTQIFGRPAAPVAGEILRAATPEGQPQRNKIVALTIASPDFQRH